MIKNLIKFFFTDMFMYIGIGFIMGLLVGSFLYTEAHAVTRGELDRMESTLIEYGKDFNKYVTQIEEIKILINTLETELKDREEKERFARAQDRLFNTEQTRDDLRNARDNLRTTQDRLKLENKDLQLLIAKKLTTEANIKALTRVINTNESLITKNSEIKEKGLTRMIGVDISTVCKNLIKNNLTSDCPTLGDLISLDSSDPRSGSFEYIDGMYQRGKPLVKNDHRLYDFDTDYKIILDPSGNLRSNIRMVTIELNFDSYLTAGDFTKQNNTRTINHDLYVDNCHNATISAKSWTETLPAVIYFLRNGCDESIYNPQTIIYDEPTEFNRDDSPAYQRLAQAEALKSKYKELRIGLD